jgi:hypothetical protein
MTVVRSPLTASSWMKTEIGGMVGEVTAGSVN